MKTDVDLCNATLYNEMKQLWRSEQYFVFVEPLVRLDRGANRMADRYCILESSGGSRCSRTTTGGRWRLNVLAFQFLYWMAMLAKVIGFCVTDDIQAGKWLIVSEVGRGQALRVRTYRNMIRWSASRGLALRRRVRTDNLPEAISPAALSRT